MNEKASESLRHHAREAVARLHREGFIALWAGGCVRDMLRGKTPKDYDIATSALPDEVIRLFPGAVLVGKCFGVVRAPVGGHWYEIATFRQEFGYHDGRHPDSVTFTDPVTDARRRDFTVNALFYDPISEQVLDFVNGRRDIAARIIRTVGEPDERFREDYLRILRAARFSTVLGFSLDPATAEAVTRNRLLLAAVSPDRIRDEITRILLEAPAAGDALESLSRLRLLDVILPEVEAMRGQAQPPEFHPEGDVFAHTVLMLNEMKTDDRRLAFAVLLHDVGKPRTARQEGDRIRFDNHAAIGAAMAQSIMEGLHFPTAEIEVVAHSIRNHMRFMEVQNMRQATLRRLVGAPTFPLELEMHRLDCLASHRDLSHYEFLLAFQEKLKHEPVLPKPWVDGHDIMALGIPEGPEVKVWHQRAYDAQIEGRFPNRDALLAWLQSQIPGR